MRHFSAIAVACLMPGVAFTQEKPLAVKNLPANIAAVVRQRFPDARITGASRESEEGKQFIEVTLKRAGRTIDVTFTLAGEMTLIETEIARKELPAGVVSLLEKKYPKANYRLVETVMSVSGATEKLDFYEVLLKDAKKQLWEVQLAPDGSKVIKVEKKN